MKWLLWVYLLLGLVVVREACAVDGHTALVHLTAHTGASYALQTVFYGVNTRALKLSAGEAEALALVETLAIGLLYKAVESESSTGDDVLRATTQNALGAGLAIGTHVLFKF